MKFVILTYQDNFDSAILTKFLLKKDWNITADIIIGFKVGEDTLKHNQVCMAGFKKLMMFGSLKIRWILILKKILFGLFIVREN